MAHFISKDVFQHWKEGLQSIVRRFPLTLFFTIASCLSLMYLNHDLSNGGEMKGFEFFLMFYPLTATVLSLTLHLWTENMRQRLKKWCHTCHLAGSVYLLGHRIRAVHWTKHCRRHMRRCDARGLVHTAFRATSERPSSH